MSKEIGSPWEITRRGALITVAGTGAALVPAVAAQADPSAPPDDSAEPAQPTPAAQPDDQGVSRTEVRANALSAQGSLAWTAEPFELVALTWTGNADVSLAVRVRTAGTWSEWNVLSADDHSDGAENSSGTQPFWVGDADAVEIADPGTSLPDDLTLVLIHPQDEPATLSRQSDEGTSAPAATTMSTTSNSDSYPPMVTSQPTIGSRAWWGADESIRQNQDGVAYGEVRGGFVHHTATSNDYSYSDVPAIIRSIYRYHVLTRDFYDIGYNFLIDRFGRIWQGAYGGGNRAVIAAHTKYYNSHAFGVGAIGNFQTMTPSSRVIASYRDLFAWKFDIHRIQAATITANYTNSGAEPLPAISAHRDTKATTCPGDRLYSRLDTIRSGVQEVLDDRVKLQLTGHGGSIAGTGSRIRVYWEIAGVGVDGVVRLQRRLSNGSWRDVRDIRVSNGYGTDVVGPHNDIWLRVRAISTSTDGVDTSWPNGISTWHKIRTVGSDDSTILDLSGPKETESRRETDLYISWMSPHGRVDGVVSFQREDTTGWTHVRDVEVVNGRARTQIRPSRRFRYRVRSGDVYSDFSVPFRNSYLYTINVW
ncbi:N-acetylmuramoyl-L-alanine amidase [Ruania alba]|uniref:Uncharacterized conserved protein, contains LGFP repeats n=1 Tax=Ruania alba TaxID=648782 RepID=A0A1H5NAY9_9MICO|nr:N-acetylmuramoyl-L-alanine amidase [Ruania alba]SEE98715.1 Uncharacterized conserved protein, contains LGFP repeats [Ruania alba]